MMKGHDPGHDEIPSADWGALLAHWVEVHGGWTALTHELLHRARDAVSIPVDPQTVEKGLRRLGARAHKDGGQYGRWMLRFFGLPADVTSWLKWMGQYHSRFSDMPLPLRTEQLRLWDRAPMRDAPESVWLHTGLASIHRWGDDTPAMHRRLELARAKAPRAGLAAQLEVALLEAIVLNDGGDRAACDARLIHVGELLASGDALEDEERLLYESRWLDQRAYRLMRPESGPPLRDEAEALYASIQAGVDDEVSFAAYKRDMGLAYCAWKRGALEEGAAHCARAVEHAGDGGFVRLRVAGLNLWSRIVAEDAEGPLRRRARRLARLLEDEDLLRRVNR